MLQTTPTDILHKYHALLTCRHAHDVNFLADSQKHAKAPVMQKPAGSPGETWLLIYADYEPAGPALQETGRPDCQVRIIQGEDSESINIYVCR